MSKRASFHYAWIILLAVSLIRGFSGPAVNGSAGLFLTPVSSELGVGIGQLSLYLSVSSVVSLVFLPIAGGLFDKFRARTLAVAGILLQTASFIGMGFMSSVWGWYLLAVPSAIGSVLLVNLLGPVLVNRWFASGKGFVMGLMMTITSLLGALFQPLLTFLIAGRGWRFAYVAFGAVALAALLIIALFLLRDRPGDRGLSPYRSAKEKQQAAPPAVTGVPVGRAVKSMAFYMLLLFMVVLTGFAAFFQHITTFGLEQGFSMASIGTALSLSMIGSAIGSLLIGFAGDKWGAVPTGIGVMAAGAGSICLFLFGGEVFALFVAATFLHGLATSSIGVIAPLLTSAFFGNLHYEKLYSLVMTGSPLASIVLLPAYGFLYDRFGSYRLVFLFLLAALVLGAVCLWVGRVGSRKLDRERPE